MCLPLVSSLPCVSSHLTFFCRISTLGVCLNVFMWLLFVCVSITMQYLHVTTSIKGSLYMSQYWCLNVSVLFVSTPFSLLTSPSLNPFLLHYSLLPLLVIPLSFLIPLSHSLSLTLVVPPLLHIRPYLLVRPSLRLGHSFHQPILPLLAHLLSLPAISPSDIADLFLCPMFVLSVAIPSLSTGSLSVFNW